MLSEVKNCEERMERVNEMVELFSQEHPPIMICFVSAERCLERESFFYDIRKALKERREWILKEFDAADPLLLNRLAFEKELERIKNNGQKMLVHAENIEITNEMIKFMGDYQILIRQDLPLFFVGAGSDIKIRNLKNTDGITFLWRVPVIRVDLLSEIKDQQVYDAYTVALLREAGEDLKALGIDESKIETIEEIEVSRAIEDDYERAQEREETNKRLTHEEAFFKDREKDEKSKNNN